MPRERDHAYEVLAEVCGGLDWDVDRGRLNEALQIIREREPALAPVTESFELSILIRSRAEAYKRVWPDGALTPTALSKHWDALPEMAKPPKKALVNAPLPASAHLCMTCRGHKMVLVGTHLSKNERSPYDEYAPCPDCNSHADIGFWREDGSPFRPMDPATVRERMTS